MASCEKPKVLQQACVIPFRSGPNGREVCLITSIRKKRWIFPKGIVDPGETHAETGLKEAWEEAGLRGEIVGPVVGQFVDEKWGSRLEVEVMLMKVTHVANTWPEDFLRQRRWCSIEQAAQLLRKRELKRIVVDGF